VWIKRKMAQEEEEAVRSLNLKGIYFQEENKRYYPKLDMRRTSWDLWTWTSMGWAESNTSTTT